QRVALPFHLPPGAEAHADGSGWDLDGRARLTAALPGDVVQRGPDEAPGPGVVAPRPGERVSAPGLGLGGAVGRPWAHTWSREGRGAPRSGVVGQARVAREAPDEAGGVAHGTAPAGARRVGEAPGPLEAEIAHDGGGPAGVAGEHVEGAADPHGEGDGQARAVRVEEALLARG